MTLDTYVALGALLATVMTPLLYIGPLRHRAGAAARIAFGVEAEDFDPVWTIRCFVAGFGPLVAIALAFASTAPGALDGYVGLALSVVTIVCWAAAPVVPLYSLWTKTLRGDFIYRRDRPAFVAAIGGIVMTATFLVCYLAGR